MKQENRQEILFLIDLLTRIEKNYANVVAESDADYEAICEDIDFIYFRLKGLDEENELTKKAIEYLFEALDGCLNMIVVSDIIRLTVKAKQQLTLLFEKEKVK